MLSDTGLQKMHKLSLFIAFFLAFSQSAHSEEIVDDFFNLLDRCRVAIESSTKLETDGLISTAVESDHQKEWRESYQSGFTIPNSRLYIVTTNWKSRDDGTERRLCKLYLKENAGRISVEQQGLLIREFLVYKTQLLANQDHKEIEGMTVLPPLLVMGFELTAQNVNGCHVVTTFAIDPNGDFLSAGSGEQAIKPCSN